MRILIADDEDDMAVALAAILTRNRYAVDTVGNGRDALEYALSGDYDCLILDIMMPGLDGLEVVRELRAAGSTVPVLLLTALGDTDDRVTGLNVGADDYLAKPFSTEELLARVRACSRRSTSYVPDILQAGDLELNRTTFELSCPKTDVQPVLLPNKEYLIMEQLMRAPGRFIPVDRLREQTWGYDEYAGKNVIWTYIYQLRRTLTKLGSSCTIKSSRGRGYLLECCS